jgi:hypothetical protein
MVRPSRRLALNHTTSGDDNKEPQSSISSTVVDTSRGFLVPTSTIPSNMELSPRVIQEVIHPTAAFVFHPSSREPRASVVSRSWDETMLNPKNRIDSLEIPEKPLWRIDGCTGLGTQYYLMPLFLSSVPPTRMDVFIPETQSSLVREQLDLSTAFHTKDAARSSRLGITRHIIRTLDLWVATEFQGSASFGQFYRRIPFGSRIVFKNLSLDIHSIQVRVEPNHNLERQLLPLSQLTRLWGSEFPFPPVIDFYEVQVVKVLHDSVCLVRIQDRLYVFKALTSEAKYLYHELKTLCTLKPHPNVISGPVHIVEKDCSFGGKRAIVGFTTVFQPTGSLRDILPQLRTHNRLLLPQQMKWCMQLTAALEHLRYSCATYYPDMRLDNIVLSPNADIIMVDFEQRGVWCEFAAPEVNAIEYMRVMASDEDLDDVVREKYRKILLCIMPGLQDLEDERYTDPVDGYNISWLALSPVEQEAAEVYMLGRVLWCIFEGVSGPQKAAVWQSYPCESDLEFPEFERTPPEMRDLIDRCTRGRRKTLNELVVREGGELVVRHQDIERQSAEEVKEVARRFWRAELEVAEEFLRKRGVLKSGEEQTGNYHGRPTLKIVLEDLAAYRDKVC